MKKHITTKILALRFKISKLDGELDLKTTSNALEVYKQLNIAWWALSNAYQLADGREIDGVGLALKNIKL